MSRQIEFEHLNLSKWIPDEELKNFKSTVEHARNTLVKRDGAGNDFTGWLNHPVAYDKEEFERILQAAEEIRQNSDVLLVVGIGGSYLGARAAIEFLHHSFFNSLPDEKRKAPRIYFCGNSNSSKYLADLEDMLEGCDFSVNVISKSGTTTESAVAFRIIKQKLEEKYGKKEAAKRVYATTDKGRQRRLYLLCDTGRHRRAIFRSYSSRSFADCRKRSRYKSFDAGRSRYASESVGSTLRRKSLFTICGMSQPSFEKRKRN